MILFIKFENFRIYSILSFSYLLHYGPIWDLHLNFKPQPT